MAASSQRQPRRCSTICLPIDQELYREIIGSPDRFRQTLDQFHQEMPELFPQAFADGYTLKDSRFPAKLGLRLRRIRCTTSGQAFTIRPSFVLPYMTGYTDAVEKALFLRAFGVPHWALARVFGKNAMYWYRLEVSLGRNSIVGTTVRQADLPEHLLADEHHRSRDGKKNYIATTVGGDCCLGAALAQTATTEDLRPAYEVFKQEAQDVQAEYQPQTVSVDGWAATHQAWQMLFPLVVLLRCFLHGWLNIRSRGKLSEKFMELSCKVWDAYRATTRRSFGQRLRRLWEWTQGQGLSAWLLEQVQKLCGRSHEYGEAYNHPGGHRTSNMLDRVMRSMNRYFEDGQHLHGSTAACALHVRAWALLHNFRPWNPATARVNSGWRSPAERLNQHRYHDNWLHNLLASASLGGYHRCNLPPQTP
jgi:hypothetical protein